MYYFYVLSLIIILTYQEKRKEFSMKILLTAFDPFGQESLNSAQEVLHQVKGDIKGVQIDKLIIPTIFYKSAEVVEEAIRQLKADYVVALGQAAGRAEITVERIAINLDDARIPDNAGNQPIDQTIQEKGAPAYFSQLPIKAMVQRMRENDIAASLSNTAGTFVCNHIMYQIHYLIEKHFPSIKAGGFIHLPLLDQQIQDKETSPSMSLDEMVKGIELALEAIIDFDGKADLELPLGKED